MKRSPVTLETVADFDNLAGAAISAGRGKRTRPEVEDFFASFECNITRLRERILSGAAPSGEMRQFRIFDPKERTISAPCFEDRVLHHALINHIGPVIDRKMVDDSYACRTGKGCHAAIRRAQLFARRYRWFVKIDIRHYFAAIDHGILGSLLRRTFKDEGLRALTGRIVADFETEPGKGLPIGSLTSQYFANWYLDPLDRYLLEKTCARGLVRYMDDVVWWCDDGMSARKSLAGAIDFVGRELLLSVKGNPLVNRVGQGLPFCGMRIFPGAILLGKRRRRRFAERRRFWENARQAGRIDSGKLQRSMDGVLGVTAGADARSWRNRQLILRPAFDA